MFLVTLLVFIVICPMLLFFTGRVLLGKFASVLKGLETLHLSLVLGIVVLILQAILFGLFKVRFLSWPFLGIIFMYGISRYFSEYLSLLKALWSDKKLVLLLVLGILVQGSVNFPSGWRYANGIDFWSSQGHDGLWHVSLMEEIKQTFPPANPLYAGYNLQNYHFTSDIFMGDFYRIFPFFSPLDLYFRFYPIIFSLLIGLSVYVFVCRQWQKEASYWPIIFTYFCGSFGYVVELIWHRFPFSGETMFWASQGNTILGNPPHTMGIIFLTTILLLLSLWEKTKNKIWLGYLFLFGFGLATIKVSAGVIFCAGMLLVAMFYFLKTKEWWLLVFAGAVSLTNFVALKIISPTAGSFLIFEPLWFPRTMMVARLNWNDWELRRQYYIWLNTPKSWIHEILLEIEAIIIFIVGNTGIRLLGLGEVWRDRKKWNLVIVFMGVGSVVAIAIVLLFVQSGVTFNLIQFMQIYMQFFGILSGISVWRISQKINKPLTKYLLIILVVGLSVPTTIGIFFDFYGNGRQPLSYISNSELAGLDWLKNNTPKDSVIFTKPFDNNAHYRYSTQPLPIAAWYSTMYVHSLSNRRTFLSGEEQLTITGYEIETDRKLANQFMKQLNITSDNTFLSEANINYLYFRNDELDTPINVSNLQLKKVFSNSEVVIYQYVKS